MKASFLLVVLLVLLVTESERCESVSFSGLAKLVNFAKFGKSATKVLTTVKNVIPSHLPTKPFAGVPHVPKVPTRKIGFTPRRPAINPLLSPKRNFTPRQKVRPSRKYSPGGKLHSNPKNNYRKTQAVSTNSKKTLISTAEKTSASWDNHVTKLAPLTGGPKKRLPSATKAKAQQPKRSKVGKAIDKLTSGLGTAANIAVNAGNVAASTGSAVLQMEMFKQFLPSGETSSSSGDNNPSTSTATDQNTEVSVSTDEDKTCPVPPENAYVSDTKRQCSKVKVDEDDDDVIIELYPGYIYRPDDGSEDEDESLWSNRVVSVLKEPNQFYFEFEDYTKDKQFGRRKRSVCRRNIKALHDNRLSYIQTMASTPLDKIDINVQSHRQATLACAAKRLPLISLAPNQKRLPVPRTPVSIPEIKENGQTKLAWTGILWHTPVVLNSCHMDSFLTCFFFRVRASTDYMNRNLLIPGNGGENVLKELYLRYVHLEMGKTVTNDERKLAHDNIKLFWIQVFFPQYKNEVEKKTKFDFKGHESESIAENLELSLMYFVTYSCHCLENNVEVIRARKFFFPALTVEQLRIMARVDQTDYSQPLKLPYGFQATTFCEECEKDAIIDFVFIPSTTWILYIQFKRGTQVLKTKDIPTKFIAHELFLDSLVEFELGYISMSTTTIRSGVAHHLSFMYFNDKFYFYDDMIYGHLLYEPNPDALFLKKKLLLDSIVYFRA